MDFTELSNKELSEALDFHRRQRNMSRGVNESAHMRQTQVVRLLEAEESRRLEEAEKPTYHYFVTHNKGDKNSDWTVTHSKKKPFATARDAADHIMKSGGRRGGTVHTVNAKTGNIVQSRSYDSGQAGYPRDPGIGDPRSIRDLKEEASEAAYKKADRDEKRKSGAGEYYVTNHDMKKTHSEPFKTSDAAISHANAQENKTGRIHTVHHIKNGKIQKQWQYSDSAGRFASYSDHAGQTTHIHEEVEQIDELSKKTLGSYVRRSAVDLYRTGQNVEAHMNARNATDNYAKQRRHAELTDKARLKASNRLTGIEKATQKMAKEEVELDEADSVQNLAIQAIQSKLKKAKVSYRDPNAKTAREEDRIAKMLAAKAKMKKEEVELDEASKPNQYIEVINKFTGSKSHHEVHPTKAFAALNHHNSLWNTKSARIVSGKEAESIKALKMKKEEVEQIDELSKKTLGSYIKKAKDDLGSRESEVTRNYYRDPRGVTDPIKHNNDLLRKRTSRRDNINKAVDKLTNEEHTNCGTPDCCGQCSTPVNETVSANAMNPVQNKVSASLPKKGPQGAMLPFNRFRSANGGVNISAKNEEIEESAKSKMMAKLNKNVDPADYHSSADAQKHLHDIDQHQLKMK